MKSNARAKPRHVTDVLYFRKGHIIKAAHHGCWDIDGAVVFEGTFTVKAGTFVSINAAKRESRRLQAEHGQGSVRVRP